MVMLTPTQIAAVAYQAGFTGQDQIIATAVSIAESGGNTEVISPTQDYGLWQINMPAHNGDGGRMPADFFPPGTKWKDPLTNGEVANDIWSRAGRTWRDWSTFKSGAYQKFLSGAQLAVADAQPSAISNILSTISDLGQIGANPSQGTLVAPGVPNLSDPLSILKTLEPALWIGGGSLLVVLGVVMIAKNEVNPLTIAKAIT